MLNRPNELRVLVERFQCAGGIGCFHGRDTSCGSYAPASFGDGGGACTMHAPARNAAKGQPDALGLPRGFRKLGPGAPWAGAYFEPHRELGAFALVLWPAGTRPAYGTFAVPVWALEGDDPHGGMLFVRVFEPLIGRARIDIIEGGRLIDAPGAVNVATLPAAELEP